MRDDLLAAASWHKILNVTGFRLCISIAPRPSVMVTDDEAIPIVNMAFSIQYHFTNLPHQDISHSSHVAKSPATAYNFEDTSDRLGD